MELLRERTREEAHAQRMHAQHAHEARMAWMDKVVPTLRGTMDAAAVADLEARLGFAPEE